jgi:membrane protein YqaA with SNARE-associated domain
MQLFDPLYRRVLAWSAHPHAERYLGALSFAESSFFPIPPDVMLAPMCLADRARAWRFAAVTTVMSLLGGIAGYAIGLFLIEMIEPWLQAGDRVRV